MLKDLLNRDYEIGYHSVATMYITTKIQCGHREQALDEVLNTIRDYENLDEYQIYHLMHVIELIDIDLEVKELKSIIEALGLILLDTGETSDIKLSILETMLNIIRFDTLESITKIFDDVSSSNDDKIINNRIENILIELLEE